MGSTRVVADLSHRVFSTRFLVFVMIWGSIVHQGSAQCSCYSYHREESQWDKSRKSCQQSGGDLVSMETQDEWKYIKTQIQTKQTDRNDGEWWIGLVYSGQKQWKWLSNHSWTYTKWQPGKPKFTLRTENYVIIAKNFPAETFGLFNNVWRTLSRGWICEYDIDKKACSNADRWCPLTTTSSSTVVTTSSLAATRSFTDQQELTTAASTTGDGSKESSSQIPHSPEDNKNVYIIIIVLVLLLLICCILAALVYRWKRKRDLKPRNSHLSKNARVPVKLEHNSSANNLNDKIIYADVINMEGGKIQIKCDSQDQTAKNTGETNPYNSKDIVCRNADRNKVDSEKVQLINDIDGAPNEQEDEFNKNLYENISQPNDVSKTETLEDDDDMNSQEQKLLYIQIADIKDTAPSCPVKMPSPYSETDYAVIVRSPSEKD